MIGGWPATGVARFDQKAVESSAWAGWTANLERRGIHVEPNAGLAAGSPGHYLPLERVLEYNPEIFKYIDLLHESRHIAQFERAVANGLDVQAPLNSPRLYAWLEKGALDYEASLARRFGFSGAYVNAIKESLSVFWRRNYQIKYNQSPSFRTKLDQWWN